MKGIDRQFHGCSPFHGKARATQLYGGKTVKALDMKLKASNGTMGRKWWKNSRENSVAEKFNIIPRKRKPIGIMKKIYKIWFGMLKISYFEGSWKEWDKSE